jgi:hypothetical protein
MVGDGEIEIMVEDEKCWLIRAKYLLKFMEHDLEADDHAPRSTRQLGWSNIPGSKKILGELRQQQSKSTLRHLPIDHHPFEGILRPIADVWRDDPRHTISSLGVD